MMRSETFQTLGPVKLNLELPAGSIEIETSSADETYVELEARSDREQVREMVDDARIEAVRRGDGHEIFVEVRTRHGVWVSFSKGPDIRLGSPELRLRVRCPMGAELEARTKSADVSARGNYGEVDVKTASGDVNIEHATDVRLKSASGDAHVETVDGSLDFKSASGDAHVGSVARSSNIQLVSGDVHIREAYNSISANTVSGDQRYEAVLQGRLDLRAISGDVTVGVRRGSRVFIDANTVSGSTSSEFELSDTPQETPVAEDAPLVEIYAKTVSGDVRIERAPAPHPVELSEHT
jgi:Putative adhesin